MTLIFYRGYGFVPIAILFLSGLISAIGGIDARNQHAQGISTTIAGVLTGLVCVALKIRDSRAGHDYKLVSTQHTLLFIPVIFWCPLLIVIGLSKLG